MSSDKKFLTVVAAFIILSIIVVVYLYKDINNAIKKDSSRPRIHREISRPQQKNFKKGVEKNNKPVEIRLSDVITYDQGVKLAKLGFSTTEFHAIGVKKK